MRIDQIVRQSEYHTPLDIKPYILKRLGLPLCVSFYLQVTYIVFKTWKATQTGDFNNIVLSCQSGNILRAVEANGGMVHLQGLDNIAKVNGPVVFISNHMSTLETLVLPSLILPHKDVTFIIKQSLLNYPLLGPILKCMNPIAVARKNPREDLEVVFQKGESILREGRSLIVFPQSTRLFTIEPAHFNTLGIKLAKKAGVAIIPVALKTDFWGTGRIIRDFGPVGRSRDVYFTFGEPIVVKGNGRKEHQKITDFISTCLNYWRCQPF